MHYREGKNLEVREGRLNREGGSIYTVSKVRICLTSAKVLQSGELERGAHVDPCPHDLHHNQVTSQQSHHQQWSLRVSLAWLPLESRDEFGEGLGDCDPVFDSPDTQGVIDSSSCTHRIALLGETELAVEQIEIWRGDEEYKRDRGQGELRTTVKKEVKLTLCVRTGRRYPEPCVSFGKGKT